MANPVDPSQKIFETKHFQTYRRFPITLASGKGTRVYDVNGKEYLDALAGIAVNNVGHCHPKVVKAIQQQAETLIHVSNLYHNVPQSKLADLLTKVSGFDRVFFCNSGLEANEGAVKIARKVSEQKGKTGSIVYFSGCFHGRSIATITMGKEAFQKGFGPLPEGFRQLPYNDVDALGQISTDTRAVIVECVQGEGGVNMGNADFLKKIGKICKEKDIILIVDEIQTGMGRTGKMFAYEHFGLDPDIISLAKGLGSGVPIGAILAKEEIASQIVPGDHGSTFGGNPLACAAALASLEVILEEELLSNSQKTGKYLKDKLTELAKNYPFIKEVRGMGLMLGIVFEPQCRPIAIRLMERGLLVSCTAMHVIRLVPPLILKLDEANSILAILKEILDEGAYK